MYLLHGGRYASCVHAGGLSCLDPVLTEPGKAVASKEQDTMIRAFDYVVRANRKDKSHAVVVIGNAMDAFSSAAMLRLKTLKHYRDNHHSFPPSAFARWIRDAFLLLQHHRNYLGKSKT